MLIFEINMEISSFDRPNGVFEKNNRGHLTFVPKVLPKEIGNHYDSQVVNLLSKADLKLGELNGCGKNDPNIDFLIAPYKNLEAVYSSQIEGTETSISEFYKFEAQRTVKGSSEQLDVGNYVDAMSYGFERAGAGEKISLLMVKDLHKRLVKDSFNIRGVPGEIRKDQNWVAMFGAPIELATYVPPRVEDLSRLLLDWESFVNTEHEMPVLIQTALIHYQFEAIHPFSDGNGRIGRLLLSLFLAQKGCLSNPVLFLSFYFQRNRQEYYARLLKVSQSSDWNGWFKFFLRGVIEQAETSISLSHKINGLYKDYHDRIEKKKVTASTIKLVDLLFKDNPIVYASDVSRKINSHPSTAKTAIQVLEKEGILRKASKKKPIVYYAHELLNILQNP
jgi:Fic family protein